MLKIFRKRRSRKVRGVRTASSPCQEKAGTSLDLSDPERQDKHWSLGDSSSQDMANVKQKFEGLVDSEALINKKLPKELLLKIFSFLDIVSLCRCAQVSKPWNQLALDGSNWQSVDLFSFQTDVEGKVVENLSRQCGGFLKTLSLKGCRNIDDKTLQIFSQKCQNLDKLILDKCTQISDKTLTNLGKYCHRLRALQTSSCHLVSDEGLRLLGDGCPHLEFLDLSWCEKVTDRGVEHIARNCHKLQGLIVVGVTQITNESLEVLSDNCPELRQLNVQKCSSITDEGIQLLSKGCPLLESLNLSDLTNLHDDSLLALSRECPKLQTLQVAHCTQLTDTGFVTLAKKCPELQRMDLEDCIHVSNTTLRNLAANCPNITELTLSHCELITDDGIRELSSGAFATEKLRILELDNCPLISDTSLDYLIAFQNLERIELYDCQLITKAAVKRLKMRLKHTKIHSYFAPQTPPPSVFIPPERRTLCSQCPCVVS